MRLEPGSAVAVQRHTGEVIESVNAETQRAVYLAWCQEHGVDPAEQLAG